MRKQKSRKDDERKPPVTVSGAGTSNGHPHEYASEIELDMRGDISTLGDPIPPGLHNSTAQGSSVADSFTMAYDYQKASYQPSVSTEESSDKPNIVVPKDDETLDAQHCA